MYSFRYPKAVASGLSKIIDSKNKEGVINALESLSQNPRKRAKKTNLKFAGDYYVNASTRHCICFDIDEENKEINMYLVVPSPLLHKVMEGRMKEPKTKKTKN